MGYTTDFEGSVSIEPPLSVQEFTFLKRFSETRRMNRRAGPYFVDGTGMAGQGNDSDIIDHNSPPRGQPGLWCQWVPNEDGTALVWNGAEKFYEAERWMKYLIDHFLAPNPLAGPELPFLTGHVLNGTIEAQGEESDDRWDLVVETNDVFVAPYAKVPGARKKIA